MNLSGLGSLMKNAGKIKELMEKNSEELAKIEVTGESGGGDVSVIMTTKHYFKTINIADSILKEEKSIIEDLICAAINDATKKAEHVAKEKMSSLGNMFGVDLPDDMV